MENLKITSTFDISYYGYKNGYGLQWKTVFTPNFDVFHWLKLMQDIYATNDIKLMDFWVKGII